MLRINKYKFLFSVLIFFRNSYLHVFNPVKSVIIVDISCKKAYLLITDFSDSGYQLISSISVPKY